MYILRLAAAQNNASHRKSITLQNVSEIQPTQEMDAPDLHQDTVVEESLILKFLNPNVSTDEEMLKRFVHEVRFSRKITHRNVIRIYDFLKLQGSYAISMEYFPSHTLGGEIVDNKPLDFAKASGWAIDIATGMSVAHQSGIIHRDLKPANLLIDDSGLLKIVDFGVLVAFNGIF